MKGDKERYKEKRGGGSFPIAYKCACLGYCVVRTEAGYRNAAPLKRSGSISAYSQNRDKQISEISIGSS